MDDLDRLFQRLVHNIRFRSPEYLTVPFTVQDLYETLVPYRHHRRELGIETNQDYETAVARLLSAEQTGAASLPTTSQEAAPRQPAATPASSIPAMGDVDVPQGCRYCGGTLPEGRQATFCPHCGMNLSTKRCDGCGTELEGAWRFCVNCGKKVA
jgi:hypothetical protein